MIQTELNRGVFCNPNDNQINKPIHISSTDNTPHDNPIQILKSSQHFLILRFILPKLDIKKELQNGQPVTQLRFKGSLSTTELGKPKLPVYSVQIGLPSSSSVTTTVLQQQNTFQKLDPPPFINQPVDPLDLDAHSATNSNSDTQVVSQKKNSGLYPTELVQTIPVGFVRSQYIGVLHIHPVQYNESTNQIKITNDITFRIDFYGAPPTSSLLPNHSLESTAYNRLFQSMLINNEQASTWRQQYDSMLRSPVRMAPAAQETQRRRFKIPITENNMYRITYNKLKSSGIEPEIIDFDSIKVETNGVEQGFYIFDENENDTLDSGEMIVFYARELIDKFTDTNIYWFSFLPRGVEDTTDDTGDNKTLRISTRSAKPVSDNITPPKAFLTKLKYEKNVFHDPLIANSKVSETAEHYFWTALRGDQSNLSRKLIPIKVPGAISRFNTHEEAVLRVKLQGASYKGVGEHIAQINFNDESLGRPAKWKRQNDILITRTLPQGKIHHDFDNYMRIDALDDNDTPEGSFDFYLNWFELEYWHNFQAESDRLAFNSKTDPQVEENALFNITNFSTNDIDVYELGKDGITAKLIDGVVTGSSGSYKIQFEDKITGYTNYFVVANDEYQIISKLTEVPPSSLRSPTSQADYIVITHKTFLDSVQPLVEFRRSQGLTVKVVDIEEIYNEFSNGIFTPFAIQWFLRYTYQTWQRPAPTYVLLVGDAHYDYKEVSVQIRQQDPTFHGRYNLYPIYVPTYHGWAAASGETAMDHRFVNVSGNDALPDMYIGRLSVQTPEELTVMAQKIIDYEDKPNIGRWQGTLVQVADNHLDNPSDELFETSRNDLIQNYIPLGYHTKQLYLRKIKDPNLTRHLIIRSINDGTLIIEYAGHGGSHTWADERIFHLDDVLSLKNDHLPFVITTTCLNGNFDKPEQFGIHSLSEQFLHGKYGVIAFLSATRLTYATANKEFDKDLFTAMFARQPVDPKQRQLNEGVKVPTLGQIVNDAKISFISRITNLQWIPGTEQYTLFGDPATPLAFPMLEIQVKLQEIALNSSKQIVILNNEIGNYDNNQTWWKTLDFSTEQLIASAIFHNNFDEEYGNEFTQSTRGKKVWEGEYGTIRLDIPNRAVPGRGVVHLFADDDKRAAVGGAYFWVDTPIIADVREVVDSTVNHTLNIQALVYDDLGAANGISSIYIEWDETFTFVKRQTPMVRISPPPGITEFAPGGQWYQIQTPIPLPQGGREIRYRIYANDINGLEFIYPSKTERISVPVPEGPNFAVATDGSSLAPIRYEYNDDTERYSLVAEVINSGGRTVKTDIDVVFSEGNPDIEGDLIIDTDANILARITLKPEDWKDGTTVLQHTIAKVTLKEALSTGVHKIYVLINPEVDTTDKISTGNVQEPLSFDNKLHISLVVNEYYYNPSEPLNAYSLDKVFEINLPDSAATVEGDQIPLNISSTDPYAITQPDFIFAAIPRVAALRQGLLRTSEDSAQQYEVSFRASDVTLKKPMNVKLRFDVSGLEDIVRENTNWSPESKEFRDELINEAEKLGIFAWQSKYEKWRRLPSQVSYTNGIDIPNPDDETIFELENYITPIQIENANKQPIEPEYIKIVNQHAIRSGTWVIVFIESTQYEVYLKHQNEVVIHKLDKIGYLDIPYRDESRGIELLIPSEWDATKEIKDESPVLPFEFGDILIFETDRIEGGNNIEVTELRNENKGNGTALITPRLGPEQTFAVGDWFLFFTSSDHYEIRDRTGSPLFHPNESLVRGAVNKSLNIRHLGWEIHVTSSTEPYRFGDKIKFSTAQVASITAETNELSPFTLISDSDTTPPTFNLWVDGIQPQRGSVIAPRPNISILIEDINGVDLDSLIIRRGDNGKPLKPITDYTLRNPNNVNTVPIDYKPIFFPGEYAFEIEASDYSGNTIGGKEKIYRTKFIVTEMPDITPPVIEFLVNDEVIVGEEPNSGSTIDGTELGKNRITQQPNCEIMVTDETGIEGSLLNITFNQIDETDPTRRYRQFDAAKWVYDDENPIRANFSFTPDLTNGTYRLLVTATDTSENTTEMEAVFTLDEEVTLNEVFNVPNPIEGNKTFFTYQLAQSPDKVSIKIYTVSGRLIRTLSDTSAKRGNNETFWDGRDETGVRCANGVYLYRVIAHTDNGTVQKIGKLAIIR